MEIFLICSFNHIKYASKGRRGNRTLELRRIDTLDLNTPRSVTNFFQQVTSNSVALAANNIIVTRGKYQSIDTAKTNLEMLVTRGSEPGKLTVYVHLIAGDQKVGMSFVNVSNSWDFFQLKAVMAVRKEAVKEFIEKITAYENLPALPDPENDQSRPGIMISMSRSSISFFEGTIERIGEDPPEIPLDFTHGDHHPRILFEFKVSKCIPGIAYLTNNYAGLLFNKNTDAALEAIEYIKGSAKLVPSFPNDREKSFLISRLRTELDCLLSFKRLLRNPKIAHSAETMSLDGVAIQNFLWLRETLLDPICEFTQEFVGTLEPVPQAKNKKVLSLFKEVLEYLATPIIREDSPDYKAIKIPVNAAEHQKLEPVYQLISQAIAINGRSWNKGVCVYAEAEFAGRAEDKSTTVGFFWSLDRFLFEFHPTVAKAALDLYWPEKQGYSLGRKKMIPRIDMSYNGPRILTRNGYKLHKDSLTPPELAVIRPRFGAKNYLKLTGKELLKATVGLDNQESTTKLMDVIASDSLLISLHANYKDILLGCGKESSILATDIKGEGISISKKYLSSYTNGSSNQGCMLAVYNSSSGLSLTKVVPVNLNSDLAFLQKQIPEAPLLNWTHKILLDQFFQAPYSEIGGHYDYASHDCQVTLLSETLMLFCFNRTKGYQCGNASAVGLFKLSHTPQFVATKLSDLIEEDPTVGPKYPNSAFKWNKYITKISGRNVFSVRLVSIQTVLLYRVVQVLNNDTLKLVRPWTEFSPLLAKKLTLLRTSSPVAMDHDIADVRGILLA